MASVAIALWAMTGDSPSEIPRTRRQKKASKRNKQSSSRRNRKSPTKSKNPLTSSSHEDRGKSLFKSGSYEEAAEAYSLAIEENPKESKLLLNRARCRYRLGQYESCMADTEAAFILNPGMHEALYMQSLALMSLERYLEAQVLLESMVDVVENSGHRAAIRKKLLVCEEKIREGQSNSKEAVFSWIQKERDNREKEDTQQKEENIQGVKEKEGSITQE